MALSPIIVRAKMKSSVAPTVAPIRVKIVPATEPKRKPPESVRRTAEGNDSDTTSTYTAT